MEGGYGARVYDAVYRWKDYDAETEKLRSILGGKEGGTLLDVACGTGSHLIRLRNHFRAEGLEKDPEMADLARAKGLTVHEGDMESFDLGRRFDVVTCLFSSIGYMETPERLLRAVRRMAAHLEPEGLLLVEPFFGPEVWQEGYVNADFVNDDGLKIARMSVSRTDGPVAVMDMHHMVATPEGVETFVTHHRLGLFTDWEYRDAFAAAGLTSEHDPEGLMGRGLYVASPLLSGGEGQGEGVLMTNPEIQREIALGFEYSYRHDDWVTPLGEALAGLTAEEARWSPGPDIPSIGAIVLHLAAWNENIVERIRTGEKAHPAEGAWPPLPEPLDEAAWERAKDRLHTSLTSVQAMIESTTLGMIQAGLYGLADLLCRLTHNGYHLGQITKLREWMREGSREPPR